MGVYPILYALLGIFLPSTKLVLLNFMIAPASVPIKIEF